MSFALEVKTISKSYGSYSIFQNISFQLSQGEVVGLLGLNGAGKSTLLKCLATYIQYDGGSLVCSGYNAQKASYQYKSLIGFQPESTNLHPHLTVEEQLTFFAKIRSISDYKYRVDELIELLSLASIRYAPCSELSKGESQRVNFCIATVHKPLVLLLDEPTNGLDPEQLAFFRAAIAYERTTRAVLLSTHHMHEAQSLTDRIVLLHNGSLKDVERGHEQSSLELEQLFLQNLKTKAFDDKKVVSIKNAQVING